MEESTESTPVPAVRYKPTREPEFAQLHELLGPQNSGELALIEAEVRRLCIIFFTLGVEQGMAYTIRMDKSDEGIEGNNAALG